MYPKHTLMAVHRRLVKKGYYFAVADVLAYLRGIHTIFIKATVNYWLTNFRSIGY